MLDRRYQVFISTSGLDMLPERMLVSQTLVGQGFFSWGLEQRTTLSSAFTRRQIDDSDYFIVLLGSQYGELSVSGLSYLELEYQHARQHNKAILVLMHEAPEQRDAALQETGPERIEKFQHFRAQLQRNGHELIYYRSLHDLERRLRRKMTGMLVQYPAAGWVRAHEVERLETELQQLKAQLHKTKRLAPVMCEPQGAVVKVAMHEECVLDYRIHAYEAGNFKVLHLQRKLTWAQLLLILGEHFTVPMPEDTFAKCLHHYLNETALADVRQVLVHAHAVARAQVDPRTLHQVKMQMRQNEWIEPYGIDERAREVWKITSKAQKLLESNLLDSHRIFQLRSSY